MSESQTAARVGRKILACCEQAMIAEGDDGTLRICERRCRSRCCIRCGRLRSKAIIGKTEQLITAMDEPALLTLTVRSCDLALRDQLNRLRRWFANFRRSREWKAHVRGGLYVIEITWNQREQQWHPHLHVVADMRFWKHRLALSVWERCVGDHAGLHVQRISSRKKLAAYVAGYVGKSSDLEAMPSTQWAEWAEQLHGLRTVQTFGAMHGIAVEKVDSTWSFRRGWWYAGDVAHFHNLGHAGSGALLAALETGSRITPAAAARLLPKDLRQCLTQPSDLRQWPIFDSSFTSGTDPPSVTRGTSQPEASKITSVPAASS